MFFPAGATSMADNPPPSSDDEDSDVEVVMVRGGNAHAGAATDAPSLSPPIRVTRTISLPIVTVDNYVSLSTVIIPITPRDRLRVPATVIVTVKNRGRCGQYCAGDIRTFRREASLFSGIRNCSLASSTHAPRINEILHALEHNTHDISLFVAGIMYISFNFLTSSAEEAEEAGDYQRIRALCT